MSRIVTADQLIDYTGVAQQAGVTVHAVRQWRRRHPDFPTPIRRIGNAPAWLRQDINDWLIATGRLPGADLAQLVHTQIETDGYTPTLPGTIRPLPGSKIGTFTVDVPCVDATGRPYQATATVRLGDELALTYWRTAGPDEED